MSKVKMVSVTAKCSDLCVITLTMDDGTFIEGDGYVPDFMPGDHFGDYIELAIDPETGKILNWDNPSDKKMIRDVEEM